MKPVTLKSQTALFALAATAFTSCAAHADWKTDPDAIQRIYMKGVPHTDKNGRPMLQYDAARSFLPISIYHALEAEDSGIKYRLADLKAAGFTSAMAWPGQGPKQMAKAADAAGIQMIYWNPDPDDVKAMLNSPSMLAYCMDDEPIGQLNNGIEERFAKIVQRRDAIRAIDKVHPVFLVDAGWIIPPATSWWVKLNTWGDVSSHDNYAINLSSVSLSHSQGIPETVSLAVASNKETKPVWFVPQSFEWLEPKFTFTFPNVTEERCMVYTSLIHGATGVIYFALDSFVSRAGNVVGIAPEPKAKYSSGVAATNSDLRKSRDLWQATVALNSELNQLRPALLSPTADVPYEVAFDDGYKSVTKDPIRTLLKVNPAGGYVLMIANIDNVPQKVRIRFPGKKDYKLTEYFNDPSASYFERKDEDFDFLAAPYDVRVFQVDLK